MREGDKTKNGMCTLVYIIESHPRSLPTVGAWPFDSMSIVVLFFFFFFFFAYWAQSLHCLHEQNVGLFVPTECTANAVVILW